MHTLDPPPLPNALLSLDFDGTLHDPAVDPPVPARFFDVMRDLRVNHGALWGINTGRSMPQMVEGFIESRFPFLPDWVVAREHEIFFPNAFGRWIEHQPWNKRARKEIGTLFKRCRRLLAGIRHDIEEQSGARWVEIDGEPAGIISRTEEEMEWVVRHIGPVVADEPRLSWQRNSIYLRFGHRDFQKGSSLGEIARLHNLPTARCFAIGDSHNDLEMLDPAHAGMIACPANAVPEVIERVNATGGYLARQEHGDGAIEALLRFFPET